MEESSLPADGGCGRWDGEEAIHGGFFGGGHVAMKMMAKRMVRMMKEMTVRVIYGGLCI